jgi:hypothetical protein
MSTAPEEPAGAEVQPEHRPSVHAAVAAVIDGMPAVGKDGRFDEGAVRYAFRSIEGVKAALKPHLAGHGVHYAPHRLLDLVDDDVAVGDRGKRWQRVRVRVRWRVYGPAGDHFDAETRGEGIDSSDKATNKAMTGAEKQLLLAVFAIADGSDDPDRDRAELDDQPATWPAKVIKGGMVTEIAAQVTAGDIDRATALAALAWDTFGLANTAELGVADARERIDAAVELALQETTSEPESTP